jgi:hypothetical protein
MVVYRAASGVQQRIKTFGMFLQMFVLFSFEMFTDYSFFGGFEVLTAVNV